MHRCVMQVLGTARIVVRDGRIRRPLRSGGAFRAAMTANEAPPMYTHARRGGGRRWVTVGATTIVVSATLVVFAKLVGRVYYDPALAAVAGWGSVPDFGVFYVAADAVRNLGNPYAVGLPQGWLGYVYPPLLAFLMTPLTLLSFQTAVTVWALLSILCVVSALRILGVRD